MLRAIIEAIRPFRRQVRWTLRSVLIVTALWHAALLIVPYRERWDDDDYSTVYCNATGVIQHVSLSRAGTFRMRLAYDDISPELRSYILRYEDRFFFWHNGVNPVAVVRAFRNNLSCGGIRSGASTITMQLARLSDPRPRTVRAKMIEVFRAFQMELLVPKREIFTRYVNSIPMGGNIVGVGAASYFYFGKSAATLTHEESLILAGIPKNPVRLNPAGEGGARMSAMSVARRLHIPCSDIPERYQRRPNPLSLPHLIMSRRYEGEHIVRYTIDGRIQRIAEDALAADRALRASLGVFNGAVIVADTKSRNVLAYVGSPGPDAAHGGAVNGAAILRSPGSTLKPFVYARAISSGRITPQTMLFDVPRDYDAYFPHNFSGTARGMVSAREALIDSLNIPAVRLERDSGRPLAAMLTELYPSARSRIEEAGLSIALGGFLLTLEDVTALYAALLCGGAYAPLSFTVNDGSPMTRTIADARAAYLVCGMLSDYFRPDMPYAWEFMKNRSRCALKTGTSFGLRDAWCAGGNARYTVGVWLGNVDCRDSGALVGVKLAAPLFMEIFNAITSGRDEWVERPSGIRVRKACAVSGAVASVLCPVTVDDEYLPGVSSTAECAMHRRLTYRRDGTSVCARCRDASDEPCADRVVTVYDPELTAYLRSVSRDGGSSAPHKKSCPLFGAGTLMITSPASGAQYEYNSASDTDHQRIALRATVPADAPRVYWFVDGSFIGESAAGGTLFYAPARGKHEIRAMDGEGRADAASIVVN